MNASGSAPYRKLPLLDPGQRLGLLKGIRVVDLTSSLAGPYATMLLGDLGAEIIKVERPNVGDDARHWRPPELNDKGLWFSSVNRNKRSLTLDYSTEEGYGVLTDLVAKSDVVVSNQLPKVQSKLRITYEELRKIRDDLVFVSLTGFGLEGSRANLPGYDLVAEGYSGIMDLTGEAGGEPQKVGTPAADLLGGADAALGCLAALFDRSRTGKGHLVDVSLVDSMTRFLTPRLVSYLGSGELPRRSGAKDSVIAIYQVFNTADFPITVALANDNMWTRFCRAVGRTDLLNDKELADNAGRIRHRARLVSEITSILLVESSAHWLELFAREGIAAGPINRLDEVSADEELKERGLFYAMNDRGMPLPQVGLGIRFDRKAAGYDYVPPGLGEHTEEILLDVLKYSTERTGELKAKGLT